MNNSMSMKPTLAFLAALRLAPLAALHATDRPAQPTRPDIVIADNPLPDQPPDKSSFLDGLSQAGGHFSLQYIITGLVILGAVCQRRPAPLNERQYDVIFRRTEDMMVIIFARPKVRRWARQTSADRKTRPSRHRRGRYRSGTPRRSPLAAD